MHKKNPKFLILIGLFLFQNLQAQIVATPSTGCVPQSVNFSGPAGASNVFWNLGGSAGTTTLSNPSAIYTSAGNYNVTYTAIVGGSPVSYTYALSINSGPPASISAVIPASRCAPMTVLFSCSTPNSSNPISWSFGDLSSIVTGTLTTPHTYVGQGVFQPVVVVSDAVTGCTTIASASSGGTIVVSALPLVNITSGSGVFGCSTPFSSFMTGSLSAANSPVPGPLTSFNWTFGGGNPSSSNVITPGVVSFAQGQNVVQLQVTDNNQCSNTASIQITVANPSLNVSFPPMICVNANFMATFNTNMNSTNWFFGGSPVNYTNVPSVPTTSNVNVYTTGGLKTFTVNVVPGGTCQPVVQTHTVFVEEVIASFTRSPLQGTYTTCQPSLVATFTNMSTTNSGASLSFSWTPTFGLPGPPTPPIYGNVTPTQVITTNVNQLATFTISLGNSNPYNYYNYFFSPNMYLKVQSNSSASCAVTTWTNQLDTVVRTTASFYTSKKEGCAPLVVTMRDTSLTFANSFSSPFILMFPITSYTWCNGATPPAFVSGTLPLPPPNTSIPPNTFTYTSLGTYSPYLIVRTSNGCVDTSHKQLITVSDPPTIGGFSFAPNPACAGNSVTINMNALPSNSVVNHWHVDTDLGFFSGCVNTNSPSFAFSHIGVHTFTVSAYTNGCKATSVINQSITIRGPYGKFRFETNCDVNKKFVKFDVFLQEAQSAVLNYGDNTSDNIVGNATGTLGALLTHTYSSSGDYTVTLTSTNLTSTCSAKTFSQVVRIRQPRARINYNLQPFPAFPNPVACTKTRYRFTATTSTENFTDCCSGFVWYLTTPQYTLFPIEIKYPMLSLNNPLPWPTGPPVPYPLIPELIVFDNTNNNNDTFRVAGNYTMSLKVKDINGCTDTTTRIFRVSEAKPSFTFNANPLCLSDSLIITNGTQANLVNPDVITSYTWNFGESAPTIMTSTNSLFNPRHKYNFAFPPSQSFTVLCIAKNQLGCIDSLKKTITVNNPFPNFNSSTPYACIPKGGGSSVNFSAISGFASYSLSFGVPPVTWQNTNNFSNISKNYTTPGVYNSTLIVTDNQGCKATQTLVTYAYGQPTAGIVFKDTVSNGVYCTIATPTLVSTSSINITPISNFVWTIGNITSPVTTQTTVSTNISTVGVTMASLSVNIFGACQSTTTVPIYVFTEPKAKIELDKNKFCLGEAIKVSLKDTLQNGVNKWVWFFGDAVPQPTFAAGSLMAVLNKTLTYNYNSFPVSGTNGKTHIYLLTYAPIPQCRFIDSVRIEVIRIQADFMQSNNIYAHCLGLADNFNDKTPNLTNLNYLYEWNFGKPPFLNTANPSYSFQAPGVYTVSLKVKEKDFLCESVTQKTMNVFPLPKVNIQLPDTTCPSVPFTISGSGTQLASGTLKGLISTKTRTDSLKFNAQSFYTKIDSAIVSTVYSVSVIDNNNCASLFAIDSIHVIEKPNIIKWDTTVIIGEPIPLNGYLGKNYTYSWTPVFKDLNCSNCYNPVSSTTVNLTYSLLTQDTPLACYLSQHTFQLNINPKTSLDVPSAFTPNGDGVNDVVYVGGWGIRKLVYFKIYNRWGQLMFQTNDLKVGWDGTFEGIPQNMETYVYEVAVDTYLDNTLTKSGTVKIIR